jgi:hypothetical protein
MYHGHFYKLHKIYRIVPENLHDASATNHKATIDHLKLLHHK